MVVLIVFSFFSLPEVPPLVDVPCLSAQLDDSLLAIVKSQVFNHGTVASRPPVQIEELIEKPGGILVRWCKVGKEHFKNKLLCSFSSFVLQLFGNGLF